MVVFRKVNYMKHLLPYFKVLCEEHRLGIIELLLEREHCVCELIDKLGLSQATVSYHVKVLRETELITCRYIKNSTFCSLNKEGFEKYASYINEKLFKPVAETSLAPSPKAGAENNKIVCSKQGIC